MKILFFKFQKLQKKYDLQLTLTSFLLGVSYVIAPILLKTMIDGFVVERDERAIIVAGVILISVELVYVLLNYFFRYEIDKKFREEIYKNSIAKMNQENNFHSARFQYWSIAARWMFIKDIISLSLLALIATLLSFVAGFTLILAFIIFYALSKTIKMKGQEIRSIMKNHRDDANEMSILQWKLTRLDSIHFDIQGFVKFMMIMIILFYGSYMIIQHEWGMGMLWSIILVIFRSQAPMRGVIRTLSED